MDVLQVTFVAVLAFAVLGMAHIVFNKPTTGSAILAAALSGGFAAYTAIQIWAEGITMFWTNHTVNLTGIQVWWDLVMCVVIALFFIAPRARAAGMNVPLWVLISASTASIGILAMVARLFWLESQNATDAKPATSAQTSQGTNA